MIPLTNHDFQWGRSEVVIIYPELYNHWNGNSIQENHDSPVDLDKTTWNQTATHR